MSPNRHFPGSRFFRRIVRFTRRYTVVEPGPREESESTRFETRDVNATAVVLTGVGVLLVLWLTVVLIFPLFSYLMRTRGVSGGTVSELPAARPPEPRIQSNPRADLREFRAREDSELNSYRWVDRKNNLISIPIEQAIQILASRGIPPSRPGGKAYYTPKAGTRETGFEGKVEPEPR